MSKPTTSSGESTLQAIRQKLTSDPILISMPAMQKLYAQEAPTNPVTLPPYAVIDWALGKPDWSTGNSGNVEHVFSIIVYSATDTEAWANLRKLLDAFDKQNLNDPVFSAMYISDQEVGKDSPLVWFATIDLTVETTEINNT